MRRLLFPLLLTASVAVPYGLHRTDVGGLLSSFSSDSRVDTSDEVLVPAASMVLPGRPAVPTQIEGPRFGKFTDVFRFDITPAWVLGRWSRVSTAPGELDQQGYRVPLVTGTAHDDIAGALTYYFDARDQLVRISFSGTTGDTRRLVRTLTSAYGLERQGAQPPVVAHFEVTRSGKTSTLDLTVPPVVAGHRPHERFRVDLELYHPAPDTGPGKSQRIYALPF